MADSSAVDAAVVGVLIGDTGPGSLSALMPDGVFFDIANSATRFVIVSQLSHEDAYMFQGSAFESFEYLVKAVTGPRPGDHNTGGGNIKAASARIHLLLQDQTLAPVGYTLMRMQRIERVRYVEHDDANADARWHHMGGRYAVMVTP